MKNNTNNFVVLNVYKELIIHIVYTAYYVVYYSIFIIFISNKHIYVKLSIGIVLIRYSSKDVSPKGVSPKDVTSKGLSLTAQNLSSIGSYKKI